MKLKLIKGFLSLFSLAIIFLGISPGQAKAASFTGSVIHSNMSVQTECQVTINDVTGNVHFRLTGPADRWFAFAFGVSTMVGYTLEANSNNGPINERTMLGIGNPGNIQGTQNLTNIMVSTPSPGMIQIDADRMNITGDPMDYVFTIPPTIVDMVYGVSSSATQPFGYHGFGTDFRGPTTMVFTQLPIRLSVFDLEVDGNAAVLNWETQSEINSYGFDIERSPDAENWEKIAFIEGQTNSADLTRYSYRDENLLPGPNYYRIKMIDLDGSFEYSIVRAVEIVGSGINENILISPNPVFSTMKVESSSTFEGQARIMVYNMTFQKVHDQFWADPRATIEIDISHLPAGSYLVYFKHKKWTAVQRIIKAN